jgi:hypothetical protein
MGLREIEGIYEVFPKARVVQLVRDGRDVMVSAAHHRYELIPAFFSNEEVELLLNKMEWMQSYSGLFSNDQVARVASEWSRRNTECYYTARELFDERYAYIRYEDLQSRPYASLLSLLSFLDISARKTVVQRMIDNCTFTNLAQGRHPGDEDKTSFFRKGVSGDWANYLTDDQNLSFAHCAADAMRLFGYTSSEL